MKAKVMFTLQKEESKLPLGNIVNYESLWKKNKNKILGKTLNPKLLLLTVLVCVNC